MAYITTAKSARLTHNNGSRIAVSLPRQPWIGACSGKSGPKDLLLYFAVALVHDSRCIEIINFTISLALSAGTLMASAGTPYRLVPAHFYRWVPGAVRPYDHLLLECGEWLASV